jgi:hypothetical protein
MVARVLIRLVVVILVEMVARVLIRLVVVILVEVVVPEVLVLLVVLPARMDPTASLVPRQDLSQEQQHP